MALADNLAFLHLCNTVKPNFPVEESGVGEWTVSAPGELAQAAIAGEGDTYFATGTGSAIRFQWSGGKFFEPGTGSFTIAAKLRAVTIGAGHVHICFGDAASRTILIVEDSGTNVNLALTDESTGVTSEYLRAVANSRSLDTDFVVVIGRDKSRPENAQGFLYIDGVDQLATELSSFDTRDWGSSFDGSQVTFGALNTGANDSNSRVYWVAAWERALTPTEIAENMNEADLAALLGSGLAITAVDGDDVISSDQQGWNISGTGFDNATVEVRQGSTVVEQIVNSQDEDEINCDTVFESTVDLKFGAATLAVINADEQEDTHSITIVPPSGHLYVDVGTPNTTADNRITAVPDLASGDQLWARGVGGGAAPTGLQLNADATFQFSVGSTPASFEVRAWDASDSTWGDWATQSIGSASLSMDATESQDAFSASGGPLITGALDATESADDFISSVVTGNNVLTRVLTSEILLADAALPYAYRNRMLEGSLDVLDEAVRWMLRYRLLESGVSLTDEHLSQVIGGDILFKVLTSEVSPADELLKALLIARSLDDLILPSDGLLTAMQRFILLTDALSADDSLIGQYVPDSVFDPRPIIGVDPPPIVLGADPPDIVLGGMAI